MEKSSLQELKETALELQEELNFVLKKLEKVKQLIFNEIEEEVSIKLLQKGELYGKMTISDIQVTIPKYVSYNQNIMALAWALSNKIGGVNYINTSFDIRKSDIKKCPAEVIKLIEQAKIVKIGKTNLKVIKR